MKEVRWNLLKSERLKRTRGVSFEKIIQSSLVAIKEHPKKEKQNLMFFEFRGYIWVVPFVEEGDQITEGQVVCIIEAMKLMNEIKAEKAGRVVKVLLENGQPVEYGQPLFLIQPA